MSPACTCKRRALGQANYSTCGCQRGRANVLQSYLKGAGRAITRRACRPQMIKVFSNVGEGGMGHIECAPGGRTIQVCYPKGPASTSLRSACEGPERGRLVRHPARAWQDKPSNPAGLGVRSPVGPAVAGGKGAP